MYAGRGVPPSSQPHIELLAQQVGSASRKALTTLPGHVPNAFIKQAAPIFRLSEEVFRIIFEMCHAEDNSVTKMALVCKRWFDIICSDQRLWRRILVSVDPMQSTLFCGSTFACATEGLVTRCIERMVVTPIELTLVIGQINEASPSPTERKERFRLALSKMKQITFLCIVINPESPLQHVIESFSDLFNPHTCPGLPNLESLMIASATPLPGLSAAFSELLETVNLTSSKLLSLYLENVSKELILDARGMAFWFDLKRITVKGEPLSLHLTTFDGCNNLEFLSFTGELLATVDDVLPPHIVRRCILSSSSNPSSSDAPTTGDADSNTFNSIISIDGDNNDNSGIVPDINVNVILV